MESTNKLTRSLINQNSGNIIRRKDVEAQKEFSTSTNNKGRFGDWTTNSVQNERFQNQRYSRVGFPSVWLLAYCFLLPAICSIAISTTEIYHTITRFEMEPQQLLFKQNMSSKNGDLCRSFGDKCTVLYNIFGASGSLILLENTNEIGYITDWRVLGYNRVRQPSQMWKVGILLSMSGKRIHFLNTNNNNFNKSNYWHKANPVWFENTNSERFGEWIKLNASTLLALILYHILIYLFNHRIQVNLKRNSKWRRNPKCSNIFILISLLLATLLMVWSVNAELDSHLVITPEIIRVVKEFRMEDRQINKNLGLLKARINDVERILEHEQSILKIVNKNTNNGNNEINELKAKFTIKERENKENLRNLLTDLVDNQNKLENINRGHNDHKKKIKEIFSIQNNQGAFAETKIRALQDDVIRIRNDISLNRGNIDEVKQNINRLNAEIHNFRITESFNNNLLSELILKTGEESGTSISLLNNTIAELADKINNFTIEQNNLISLYENLTSEHHIEQEHSQNFIDLETYTEITKATNTAMNNLNKTLFENILPKLNKSTKLFKNFLELNLDKMEDYENDLQSLRSIINEIRDNSSSSVIVKQRTSRSLNGMHEGYIKDGSVQSLEIWLYNSFNKLENKREDAAKNFADSYYMWDIISEEITTVNNTIVFRDYTGGCNDNFILYCNEEEYVTCNNNKVMGSFNQTLHNCFIREGDIRGASYYKLIYGKITKPKIVEILKQNSGDNKYIYLNNRAYSYGLITTIYGEETPQACFQSPIGAMGSCGIKRSVMFEDKQYIILPKGNSIEFLDRSNPNDGKIVKGKKIALASISCLTKYGLYSYTEYDTRQSLISWSIDDFYGVVYEKFVKDSDGEINRVERTIYWIGVTVGSKITNRKIGFEVYDLESIPIDGCACRINEMCTEEQGVTYKFGTGDTLDSRAIGWYDIKIIDSYKGKEESLRTNMKKFVTQYGFSTGIKNTVINGKLRLLKMQLTIAVEIKINRETGLELEPNVGNKLVKGIYTKQLPTATGKDGVAVLNANQHGTHLNTQLGKFGIDYCLAKMENGEKSAARNLEICNGSKPKWKIYMFWIMIGLISLLTLASLINMVVMYFSSRQNGIMLYKFRYFLISLLFCPDKDTFKVCMDMKSELNDKINNNNKFLKTCIEFIYQMSNSKTMKIIITITSYFPVLLIPIIFIATTIWIIKVIITVLCLPLRICSIKIGFDCLICCIGGLLTTFGSIRLHKYTITKKAVLKFLTVNLVSTAFCSWIITSSIIFAEASIMQSGIAIQLKKECEHDSCTGILNVKTSIDFTSNYIIRYPIKVGSKEVGDLSFEFIDGHYKHILDYKFTRPEFKTESTQIICKSDDPDRRERIYSRFWECADCDEATCDNTGPMWGDYISKNRRNTLKRAYEGDTFDPKGFWYGLSSTGDGLQWVGLYKEPVTTNGYRIYESTSAKMKGSIKIVLSIDGTNVIDEVQEVDRYLDTLKFTSVEGQIRMTERRVSGSDLSGKGIVCKFPNLLSNYSEKCFVGEKDFTDPESFNVYGEWNWSKDLYFGKSSRTIFSRRLNSNAFSNIIYKDHQEPDTNYESSLNNIADYTQCSISLDTDREHTEPAKRCTWQAFNEDKTECEKNHEAYNEFNTIIPRSTLKLKNCNSIKLDIEMYMETDLGIDSGHIDTVNPQTISAEFHGCYGSQNMLQVALESEDSQGIIRVNAETDHLNCPGSFSFSVKEKTFNCTTLQSKGVIRLSDINDLSKFKDISFNIKDKCESVHYDPTCVDCNDENIINVNDSLKWWEILLIAIGCLAAVFIFLALVIFCCPILTNMSRLMTQSRSVETITDKNLPFINNDFFKQKFKEILNRKDKRE